MAGSANQGHKIGAFELWLRTGRRAPVEYKFNGWHDPDDGKFTFKGAGTYHGSGSGGGGTFGGGGATGHWGTADQQHARERQAPRPAAVQGGSVVPGQAAPLSQSPKPQSKHTVRKGDTLETIAKREGMTVEQLASVNSVSDPNKIKVNQQLVIPTKDAGGGGRVSVQTNDLTFEIDAMGLTVVVQGKLGTENDGRSKTLQAQAGKPDRERTDDGGHFIAPRLGGPKATYNHFAQDSNFNRGEYRILEDQWAKAQRERNAVSVRINASYPPESRRPNELIVSWTLKGHTEIRHFMNANGGRRGSN